MVVLKMLLIFFGSLFLGFIGTVLIGMCTGLMKAFAHSDSDIATAIMMILVVGIVFMIMLPIAVSIL